MERLEVALEKAREKRQAIQEVVEKGTPDPVAAPKDADAWGRLRELNISTRVARANRITTLTTGPLSSPYDILRSRTLRVMRENNWKRLAITSPNAGCGKTTVATNLAISIARQSDLKVMVLDVDMRRPALSKILGHKDTQSLHGVFAGRVPAENQLLRLGENLAFGLNYKPAANPAELLHSNKTREILDELEQVYQPDIMIFDMPPMQASDDNVGFLPIVDCALLVAAAEGTKMKQIDNSEKELAELTNVLGIVLNKCRYMDSDSGYDYEYY